MGERIGDRHPENRQTAARSRLHRTASRSRRHRGTGSDRGADLATKTNIAELRTELKGEFAELRNESRAEIAELRSELRQTELRLEAKIEAMKADILNRIFGLILGARVVNIVATVGAVFAVAKLVGH